MRPRGRHTGTLSGTLTGVVLGCVISLGMAGFASGETQADMADNANLQGRWEVVVPPLHWQGEGSCEGVFAEAPAAIPGGPDRDDVSVTEAGLAGIYGLGGGSTLEVLRPEVIRHPVYGKSYAEVFRDMSYRRPLRGLAERYGAAPERGADGQFPLILASTETVPGIRYWTRTTRNGVGVRRGGVVLTLRPTVYVAEWGGFATASAVEQEKWRRLHCEHVHHELGHILIAAEVLADSEAEFRSVRGATRADFDASIEAVWDRVNARIAARQQLYHDEIDAMGLAVADSRPFAELPFSWLDE